MEFWGVEVKSGESLSVDPGEDMIVHISHAALGEKTSIRNEQVRLYLKVGDQKLMVGTLSHDKFPQLSTEMLLEKPFQLSHSWKEGSVFFTGYKVDTYEPDAEETEDEKDVKQVNFQLPNEGDEESEDTSSDDDSSEESGDEEEKKVAAEVDGDEDDEDDSSDDDEDDDSSEDDGTPQKVEERKKRSADTNTLEKPVSNKKAKFVTPQKTETKKPHVHVATPHPSKQGGKNSGSNGEASKTPKSAGTFGCNSCNRKFTSEMGLQSHTKAKHSAAA